MAQEWPAYTRWSSESYLREVAGDEKIEVERTPRESNEFAYFKTDYEREEMTFGEFLTKVRDP